MGIAPFKAAVSTAVPTLHAQVLPNDSKIKALR
jgi:hypothetical protein